MRPKFDYPLIHRSSVKHPASSLLFSNEFDRRTLSLPTRIAPENSAMFMIGSTLGWDLASRRAPAMIFVLDIDEAVLRHHAEKFAPSFCDSDDLSSWYKSVMDKLDAKSQTRFAPLYDADALDAFLKSKAKDTHPFPFGMEENALAYNRVRKIYTENRVYYIHADIASPTWRDSLAKCLKFENCHLQDIVLSNVGDFLTPKQKNGLAMNLQYLLEFRNVSFDSIILEVQGKKPPRTYLSHSVRGV